VKLIVFLNSALDVVERTALSSGHLFIDESDSAVPCIGSWLGARIGLELVVKRIHLVLDMEVRQFSCSLVTLVTGKISVYFKAVL
jgi:hypothetical protein